MTSDSITGPRPGLVEHSTISDLLPPRRVSLVLRRPVLGGALMVLERVAALLALMILMPVLVLVAIGIRLDTKGPVLFTQVRVGQYGRYFPIVKFRTMRVGADAELSQLLIERDDTMGAYVKITGDPRITRLGAVLRKTSLDELPQLFNVVRGDMALVGPRPQTPAEIATYQVGDWRRLLVRPGITGMWQVSGRSDLSAEEALELDRRYVQEWTPMLDVRLLVRTVGVVVSRRGAH